MALAVFLCQQKGYDIKQADVKMAKTIIYVGIILGVIVELAAFVMGIFGFFYAKAHRTAKGGGHALSAISMGALFLIGELIALVLIIQYIDTNFKPIS
jgi:hypothetical protein